MSETETKTKTTLPDKRTFSSLTVIGAALLGGTGIVPDDVLLAAVDAVQGMTPHELVQSAQVLAAACIVVGLRRILGRIAVALEKPTL